MVNAMADPRVSVLSDPQTLAQDAADRILTAAGHAVAERGVFSVALSGGHTPRLLYELLAAEPMVSQIDWPKWNIFFGDERCVPPDHPDSNYRMAREALFDVAPIPVDNIFRMRGEIDPHDAAREYGEMLRDRFDDTGLDLVLLGMGDDGHTASLFPHSQALKEKKHRCAANFAPDKGAWRITLTAPFINRANQVMVLIDGAAKAARVQEVLEGPRDPDRLPIQLIAPTHGPFTWLLDAPAAGMAE
jgi:6-phosphogluconolactonase